MRLDAGGSVDDKNAAVGRGGAASFIHQVFRPRGRVWGRNSGDLRRKLVKDAQLVVTWTYAIRYAIYL